MWKKVFVLALPILSIAPISLVASCNNDATSAAVVNQQPNQAENSSPEFSNQEKPAVNNQPSFKPEIVEQPEPVLPTVPDINPDTGFNQEVPVSPTKPEANQPIVEVLPDEEEVADLPIDVTFSLAAQSINSLKTILADLNFQDQPVLALLNHNVITKAWIVANQQILFNQQVQIQSEDQIRSIILTEDPTTTKLSISVLLTNDQVVQVVLTGFQPDKSLSATQSAWPMKSKVFPEFTGLNQTEATALIDKAFIIKNIDKLLQGTTRFLRSADLKTVTKTTQNKFLTLSFTVVPGRAIAQTGLQQFSPSAQAITFETVIDFN